MKGNDKMAAPVLGSELSGSSHNATLFFTGVESTEWACAQSFSKLVISLEHLLVCVHCPSLITVV